MADPPRKIVNARIPRDTAETAADNLTARSREMNAYIEAAIRAAAHRPDEALDFLAADWPPPRKPGRPRRGWPDGGQ